jgi:hypothetical protein
LGLSIATAATIGLATEEEASPGGYALMYGAAALSSGLGIYILGVETPTERLLRLYRDDPGMKVRAGVTALPGFGFGLGLSGSF